MHFVFPVLLDLYMLLRMTTVWKPKPAAQIRASRIAMSLAKRQSLDVVVEALLKT